MAPGRQYGRASGVSVSRDKAFGHGLCAMASRVPGETGGVPNKRETFFCHRILMEKTRQVIEFKDITKSPKNNSVLQCRFDCFKVET
jgi:hypothetical protein